jgi:hypothetical protein
MKLLKKFLILLTIISISDPSHAAGVLVKAGTPVPFDGFLFNYQDTNDIKNQLIDKDMYKQLTESYQRTIEFYNKKDSIYENQITLLNNENQSLRSRSEWSNYLWFALGVLATGFAVYGAKKVTQ